ncbi:MAG TPA: multiheme c-type cytochrome [Casimicrobiaceae bacterium]|jgi:hypothetical protein|nr:multiheme c-type cytochrome [Casimicrobiaceae bacterium]
MALLLFAATQAFAQDSETPVARSYAVTPPAPARQTAADVRAKSMGCSTCHTATDHASMHVNPAVLLGCTDCHGGDAKVARPQGAGPADSAYRAAIDAAHVLPRYPRAWNFPSSAKPERTYTLLNREAPQFVRFLNPGDYRAAGAACGACHQTIIQAAERSLMSTSAMLWGGASYNNGILPYKRYLLGESYSDKNEAAAIVNPVPPTPAMIEQGILAKLYPLPAWETVPVGDIFRVFERGGRVINAQFPEIGLPNITGSLQKLDEAGRPDIRQSNRGPGTGLRIAVPVINITKTRLNDPHMWFLGTNDQPGDYRSSGCSGCHVVYANDRDPKHSGRYAAFGNTGKTQTVDPTIPKDESGHPLQHVFTRVIPSSQCMVCHMHQPNVFVNSYYGYIMWDYESDAPFMWPEKQRYPTSAEIRKILDRNPEEASIRGKWSDPEFLKEVSTLNPKLKDTQFADYHGHGWNFRAVFKRDRHGTLLDKDGKPVADDDPDKFKKAVHLSSIHADLGFQCVDCHFAQDAHGNGYLYGEVAAAIEIGCEDCHGTVDKYPTLFTGGPASQPGGTDMTLLRTEDGRKRFEWREGKLYQRAALDADREWEVTLVKDTVNPASPKYNAKAARAKLMSADGSMQWGPGVDPAKYAHGDDKMTCYTCHLSWTTSCAGCHLPIQANWKTARLHYEGSETRNYATYNPQVARDDMFQLGHHGPVKGGKIAPIRSSSALILSSTNINREHIYIQQPPISAAGFSSQAFAPHYPHTERKTETKTCSDCHVAQNNDNNAIMAQLLLQGTNFVNFVGYNAWVGEEKGIAAIQVTEWEEPQAVIGSYLHRYAYPDWFAQHQKRDLRLPSIQTHDTQDAARCVQLRGEYLYVAEGRGGMRVYDVASIGNKGFSQKIVSAPFSPFGQDTHIASSNATCVALPTNQSISPPRNKGELMRVTNQEQPFHPIYSYAAIVDSVEGLILTDVDTLSDRDPQNNFLTRAVTWNEAAVLNGARHIVLGGHFAYISADAGLVIVDLDNPLQPKLAAVVPLKGARAAALQFRYVFVLDDEGLTTIDVTDPTKARQVGTARVPLADARRIYVARTYAYIAAGREGLVIVDVERPEAPRLYMKYNADGNLNDARDVIVGSTNASLFAYVADGANGLKVLQLTSPEIQPKFYGFSPEPRPTLIAWRPTPTPALALSKGLDRDRAVDETGGQIAVFGRIGSRPFTWDEMKRFYQRPDGSVWTVTDDVRTQDFLAPRAVAGGSQPAGQPKQ